MYDSAVVLFIMVLAFTLLGVILYWGCHELGKREKKTFRHSASIIQEKELKEVVISKSETQLGSAPPLEKNGTIKGMDFYSGKTSLSERPQGGEEDDDILQHMLYGKPLDSDEEEEREEGRFFHVGKTHVLD